MNMFLLLLLVTFAVAAIISLLVVKFFAAPINKIFWSILKSDLAQAWERYVRFAALVTGISGGVRIWALERYIVTQPRVEGAPFVPPPELNWEVWTLEVYRTIIETLQSLTWLYFGVFFVALIAYVLTRYAERRGSGREDQQSG